MSNLIEVLSSEMSSEVLSFIDDLHTCLDQMPLVIFKDHVYLAGGALRDLFNGKHIKDVDIFFKDPVSAFLFEVALKNSTIGFYKTKFSYNINAHLNNNGFRRISFITDISSNGVEATLPYFDFFNNMIAYDFKTRTMYRHKETILKSDVLKFNVDAKCVMPTLNRTHYFIAKGYKADSRTIITIANEMSKRGHLDPIDMDES